MWHRLKQINFDALTVAAIIPLLGGRLYLASRSGSEYSRDAESSASCANLQANKVITAAAVRHLERHGYVLIPGAQSDDALARSVQAAERTNFEKSMNHADVRQDQISWIQKSQNEAQLDEAVGLLRGIAYALESQDFQMNREASFLVPQRCQLSYYPGDGAAGYKAHRDAPASDLNSLFSLGLISYLQSADCRRRRLTCILYLNPPRRPMAGGHLQCFLGAATSDDIGHTATSVLHIEPKGGDLFIFDSLTMLHAVLPTTQRRFALTTWLLAPSSQSPATALFSAFSSSLLRSSSSSTDE